jgi:hypothetical protein
MVLSESRLFSGIDGSIAIGINSLTQQNLIF